MTNLVQKFNSFLENLTTNDNYSSIEVIKEAFNCIYESLSTDDANQLMNNQKISEPGAPAVSIKTIPNQDNEYFKQTLSDKDVKKAEISQFGKGIKQYPKAGKWTVSLDPSKSGHGTNPNANGDGGGDSGGDNIGDTL